MKQIYFVRHGETEWNATARMQGQMDSVLTPLGRQQAENHARLLAPLDIQAIFASPLKTRPADGLMEFAETEVLSFAHPNEVVYRVRVSEQPKEDLDRELHHYIAAEGPFEGTVDRW